MDHDRQGNNLATTTIHYPPMSTRPDAGPDGVVFGEVLVK